MPSIDRNERARLMAHAEALDRRTHQPGEHGGCLKRSGLAVFRALLFTFRNIASGRCDPGYNALARASGCARSTVHLALRRLERAGLLVRHRRQVGIRRLTNAYVLVKSDLRTVTTDTLLNKPLPSERAERARALAALLGFTGSAERAARDLTRARELFALRRCAP